MPALKRVVPVLKLVKEPLLPRLAVKVRLPLPPAIRLPVPLTPARLRAVSVPAVVVRFQTSITGLPVRVTAPAPSSSNDVALELMVSCLVPRDPIV